MRCRAGARLRSFSAGGRSCGTDDIREQAGSRRGRCQSDPIGAPMVADGLAGAVLLGGVWQGLRVLGAFAGRARGFGVRIGAAPGVIE